MRRTRFLVTSVTLAVACAGVGISDAGASKSVAKKYARMAMHAYGKREFSESIAHYLRAYDEYPAPEFLFNAAQAYRLSGRCPEALEYYEEYLTLKPDAHERKEVEGRIRTLSSQCRGGTRGARADPAKKVSIDPTSKASTMAPTGTAAVIQPDDPSSNPSASPNLNPDPSPSLDARGGPNLDPSASLSPGTGSGPDLALATQGSVKPSASISSAFLPAAVLGTGAAAIVAGIVLVAIHSPEISDGQRVADTMSTQTPGFVALGGGALLGLVGLFLAL